MEASSYARLQEEHTKEINIIKDRIKQWEKFTNDYEAVQERLKTLPKKLSHDVMVPLCGNIAFMPGKLYHTNEVLVLLGDNWFTECSADHAWGIAERRKKYTMEKLKSEQKDLEETLARFTLTREVQESNEDFIEIREEFDPVKERKWKEENKKKLKKEKEKEKECVPTHDEIWARLNELEEEEKRMEEGETVADHKETNRTQKKESTVLLTKSPSVQQTIVFKHTQIDQTGNQDQNENQDQNGNRDKSENRDMSSNERSIETSSRPVFLTPGDIFHGTKPQKDNTNLPMEDSHTPTRQKKRVTFSTNLEEEMTLKSVGSESVKPAMAQGPKLIPQPFTGHVVERVTTPVTSTASVPPVSNEVPKKVSKFKAEKQRHFK